MHQYRNPRGFTLIELMVVVVILGILAAFVVPKLLGRPDEARVTRAIADIKGIEQALGLYKLDNGFYPATEQGLAALVGKPERGRIPSKYPDGGYLKKLPVDPWGHEYRYLSPAATGDYAVLCYGADGEAGGEGANADLDSNRLD